VLYRFLTQTKNNQTNHEKQSNLLPHWAAWFPSLDAPKSYWEPKIFLPISPLLHATTPNPPHPIPNRMRIKATAILSRAILLANWTATLLFTRRVFKPLLQVRVSNINTKTLTKLISKGTKTRKIYAGARFFPYQISW